MKKNKIFGFIVFSIIMKILIFGIVAQSVEGATLVSRYTYDYKNINGVINLNKAQGNVSNFTKYYGDGSSLTGISSSNFTFYGNTSIIATADSSGGCTNRPFTSTADKTIELHTTDSIQETICENLPYFLRHRLTINIDGDYTGMENITIPPYVGEQSIDYEGGQLRIRSVFGENAKIGSIFASGIMGQAQPYFEGLNVTGYHPYYTGRCQICLFGVQTSEMYSMTFSGNPSNNVYGVTSYGGNVKMANCKFENGTQYALETKQGGKIYASNITGAVTNTPFYATSGWIQLDLPVSTITGGVGQYKKLVGFILEQRDTSFNYLNNSMRGVDELPEVQMIGEDETNLNLASTNTLMNNFNASTDGYIGDDLTIADDLQVLQAFVNCKGSTCTRDLEVNSTAGGIRMRAESANAWGPTIAMYKRGNDSDASGIVASGATLGYLKYQLWDGTSPRDVIEVTGYTTQIPNSTSRPAKLTISVVPTGATTIRTIASITEDGIDIEPSTYRACSATTEGVITYNATAKKHYGCNSTAWNALY